MIKRWQLRRRITIGTLVYCSIMFAWIVVFGNDDSLRRSALEIIGMVAMGAIAVYTGGKTWLNIKETTNGNYHKPD